MSTPPGASRSRSSSASATALLPLGRAERVAVPLRRVGVLARVECRLAADRERRARRARGAASARSPRGEQRRARSPRCTARSAAARGRAGRPSSRTRPRSAATSLVPVDRRGERRVARRRRAGCGPRRRAGRSSRRARSSRRRAGTPRPTRADRPRRAPTPFGSSGIMPSSVSWIEVAGRRSAPRGRASAARAMSSTAESRQLPRPCASVSSGVQMPGLLADHVPDPLVDQPVQLATSVATVSPVRGQRRRGSAWTAARRATAGSSEVEERRQLGAELRRIGERQVAGSGRRRRSRTGSPAGCRPPARPGPRAR